MNKNPATEPFADPGVASVEDGYVILEGPDGIAITLTPEAAVATGSSLVEAGERALTMMGQEGPARSDDEN